MFQILKIQDFINLMSHILCKVIHELETIPINKRFCGGEWKTDPLKRFKQIKSQLRLKSGMLVRSYKTDAFYVSTFGRIYSEIMSTILCYIDSVKIDTDTNRCTHLVTESE